MFEGPPEGSEVTWDTARLSYRIVSDDDLETISPVVGHTMVEYRGSLIVWGGYYRGRDFLFRYRPSTFLYILPGEMFALLPSVKWIVYHVPYGSVPPSTSGACSTLCHNKLCIFGGYSKRSSVDQGHSSEMYVLDLDSETWSKADIGDSRLPTPRDKMVGWQYQGRCYYFGGYGPRPDDMPDRERYFSEIGDFIADEEYNLYWNNQLVVYNPDINSRTKWTVITCGGNVPSARAASSCTFLNKYSSVLLFGGRSRALRLNDLYMLDMNSLIWTEMELLSESPEGRTWCSLEALSAADALLYGGYSNAARALDDIWRISVAEDSSGNTKGTWTRYAVDQRVAKPRLWHTAAIIQGQLLVCGGADSFMEHVSYMQGTLKFSVQPASLFSICFAVACRDVNFKGSLLHSYLRLYYDWARFIQTYGRDGSLLRTINTEKNFRRLKLTHILNLSCLGG